MKLHFEFENINLGPNHKFPEIAINVNSELLYKGLVQEHINLNAQNQSVNQVEIIFLNKQNLDTECDSNGGIVSDMNFSIRRIVIDDYDLEELIWQGQYRAHDNQIYPGCLFFGPAGQFELEFENPVLKWILKTRHEKNQNDPNWEEDYNYYITACKILSNL